MLRNITSLSVPVSTWPCKTTSWHRRHPRLTFSTARSTFSLEILFTISVNPRCWGGLPLRTIFIATIPICLSTLRHSSPSTRLHTLSMGHGVGELSHLHKRRHVTPTKLQPVSSLFAYRRRVSFALRARFESQQEGSQPAPSQERRECAAHCFCPGRIILCSNLRLGIPLSSPVFVSL
ncbi:hypothetical protein ARMGADRAFT_352307 [Armillaria gallica]|uniref:Uncharacterized protein n=1 Tax=Armillaria gallica TaxID=47427 RepID=A0A2H3D1I8_ARMGA|nr:hypothetical protein ARMGADRAFT_352307 [Armillaria gallica]